MMKHTYVIVCMALCSLSMAAQQSNRESYRITKNMTIYSDVMRQLDMNYVDTLDYEMLTETAINQMLRRIDPYTMYIPKREDDNLRMMTTGKYGGIGAIIMQRDSAVYIAEPYEGMPAQLNDVLAGDKILEVDGMKCSKKTTKEVSDRLRGKPGTTVHLVLEREGEAKPIVREIERKEIHLPAVSYAKAMENKTGYVLFSEFTAGSAQDFLIAVDKMVKQDGIDRLIIDLRSNGGGIIDEALQLVSYFVDKGTEVVSTKGKIASSCRSYTTSTSPLYRDMPLVVLVDGNSASAAEIVSGGLQDLGRAKLIGQRTFGKGLVQSVRPIAYDGHVKITTAYYYLPSGRCIQAIDYNKARKDGKAEKDTTGGVLPDIVLTDSQKVDISYTLYAKNMLFDYSVRYHREHATVASPEEFELTDEEIEQFIQFLDEKKFSYETETSKFYEDMLRMARHEDIDTTLLQELEAIKARLKPSYRDAIMRNLDEVKQALGAEIMERYYYQKGRIAFLLRYDKELKRAKEEIGDW
ncbi:MAG: S41 family peptidase [Paludibacteraceae bacterium]|nr:S41 family peptidase [Paludibacteraceae bacterium]